MILTINCVISLNGTNRVAHVMSTDYGVLGVLTRGGTWKRKTVADVWRELIVFDTSVTVYKQKQFNPYQHEETLHYRGALCVL